jgi:hypothetical protein
MRETAHVMGQLAACRRTAGIALMRRPALVELRGDPNALAAAAAGVTGGWWMALGPRRALLLADRDGPAGSEALLDDLAASAPDVAVEDRSAAYGCVVLAGPLASRLVISPAARLAQPLLIAGDGDDHCLLVVDSDRAEDAWHVLLDAGRADGAIAVAVTTARLYRAGRRTATAQHCSAITIDTNPTGALPS